MMKTSTAIKKCALPADARGRNLSVTIFIYYNLMSTERPDKRAVLFAGPSFVV